MILTVAALSFSFTACNETKKDASETAPVGTEVAQDTVATATQTPDEMFAAYETFVNKFAAAVDGISKGDTNAMVEYGTLSQEAATISNLTQDASANFSLEQKEMYGKLVEKFAKSRAKAIEAMTPKK